MSDERCSLTPPLGETYPTLFDAVVDVLKDNDVEDVMLSKVADDQLMKLTVEPYGCGSLLHNHQDDVDKMPLLTTCSPLMVMMVMRFAFFGPGILLLLCCSALVVHVDVGFVVVLFERRMSPMVGW